MLAPVYTFPENLGGPIRAACSRARGADDPAIADLCLTDLGKPTAVLESLDGPMSERRPESATAAGTSRAAPSRMTSSRNPVTAASTPPADTATAPLAFHLLAKPTGAICNLDCAYCFFLSKEVLYPAAGPDVPGDLDAYIRQLLEAHRTARRWRSPGRAASRP